MKPAIALLFCLMCSFSYAQELKCTVQILPPQATQVDPSLFQTMKSTVEDFMNSRKWTNDIYRPEERIECTILITIDQQISQREFKGTIQVNSSRPVYNSNQKTSVLSINDHDFQFTFQEGTQIVWSQDQHRDNLSSTLAFYAYLILAMDYDTFALEGGTDYYLMCQTIVVNAQSSADLGWHSNDSRSQQNRYWIIENIVSTTFKPIREALYNYHRKGLDKMYIDPTSARKVIGDALLTLGNVHRSRPSSYNMQIFFYAKADEVVNIFKPVSAEEKTPVYNLCKLVDPGNITKYERIMAPN
jgi:Domain of unknown function (DUF4835)